MKDPFVENLVGIIDSNPKDNRLTLADVAKRSSFNSQSSFNRYFSKIMGVTPSNYFPHTAPESEATD